MNRPLREFEEQRLGELLREASTPVAIESPESIARTRRRLLARVALESRDEGLPAPFLRTLLGWKGGLAAAAVLLIAGLVLVSTPSPGRLSAMELTAQTLREVRSYSYRLQWEANWKEDDGRRLLSTNGDGMTYWQAPDAFRNEMTIAKTTEELATGKQTKEELEHFAEIFPPGGRGVLIDYRRQTYVHVPFDPTGSKTYPYNVLRMIREDSYDVERDLGTRKLGDATARGFVLKLKSDREESIVRDPVELWVDTETNLPLEFSYQGSNGGSTYEDRATNFQWNIELDAKLFDPTIPAGFDDITPPSDQRDLEQIAAALRLYSRLSGGRYPRSEGMDAAAVLAEMKKLAGFTGPAQPQWEDDPTYRQIMQSRAGLDWIQRILRNRFLSGYRGRTVGPTDRDQVLLWWMESDNHYRVYYGDLRTALLSEEQWKQLVPDGASAAPE